MVSLIEDGLLDLGTSARSVLAADLPLIDEDVTIEDLLSHRSGIGDYLDEDDQELDRVPAPGPVHELATTEQYLAVLDGHPSKFAPGERFSYCNSGYVVLALIAERTSGVPFHELVRQRVCDPAGMDDTEFLRSDQLPGHTAVGYLETYGGTWTNVLHLPVRGMLETAGSTRRWLTPARLLGCALRRPNLRVEGVGRRDGASPQRTAARVAAAPLRPRVLAARNDRDRLLRGSDAGVSFRSVHDPR